MNENLEFKRDVEIDNKMQKEFLEQVDDVNLLKEFVKRIKDNKILVKNIFDKESKPTGEITLLASSWNDFEDINFSQLTKKFLEKEIWVHNNQERIMNEGKKIEKELTFAVWGKMTNQQRKDWMLINKLRTEEEIEKYWG